MQESLLVTSLQILTASATIPASANDVFAFLSDPRQHHVLDGSGSVQGCADAPETLSVGSVFTMRMRLNGLSYRSHNEVVEFAPPHQIAWRTTPHSRLLGLFFGGQTWRFALTEESSGCVVTESWDPSTIDRPKLATRAAGFASVNERGMQATVDRLREHFSAKQT
jgi:uncharacterized protein YndB with AHSA1/START domain